MTEKESSWGELSSRLEALGLKLKMHYEQAGDSAEARETLEKLKKGVQDAFDATGNAVKDEAVRSDVKEAGRVFADAIGESLNKLGDAIKRKAD